MLNFVNCLFCVWKFSNINFIRFFKIHEFSNYVSHICIYVCIYICSLPRMHKLYTVHQTSKIHQHLKTYQIYTTYTLNMQSISGHQIHPVHPKYLVQNVYSPVFKSVKEIFQNTCLHTICMAHTIYAICIQSMHPTHNARDTYTWSFPMFSYHVFCVNSWLRGCNLSPS